MHSLTQAIIFFTFLGTLVPVYIGLRRYQALEVPAQRMVWLVLASFIFDVVGHVLWWCRMPNLVVGNVYALVEFGLIACVYKFEFQSLGNDRWLTWISTFALLFFVINLFWGQGLFHNNTLSKIIESILLIFFAIFCFYENFRQPKATRLKTSLMFWFNSGVLFYFSGSVVIFIFSNYILAYSQALGMQIWLMHSFFMLTFYSSISIALWINPKKQSLSGY